MMTICTFNARTLASEASIEDLMVQARKIRYDVIGLTETRRHRPLNATFDTGEELFLGTCDSRGVGGVGVLVNTNLAMSHLFRTTDDPNRTFATEEMWINAGPDSLRRLRSNIQLR
ncbi:hypothetical protein Y032_0029g2009 [Ancylostoma ceylanicum]|uniref:Endonuclease/exonuclease/phosphatase domain-containing protein n=1 Tax=Ancylostoma ceylanicum TaxID=53326 RepID=A0A016UT82_9BILA|nr:hypothetical protein Y032_0029g2009 [Ancylostoma ceylanicum]